MHGEYYLRPSSVVALISYVPQSRSPGRFFAALEMKLLLAHMVMTYDIQFENGGPQPPGVWRGASVFPDRTAKVYFKKRSV